MAALRMTDNPIEGFGPDAGGLASIQAAVETQHECKAVYRDVIRVREDYEGKAVWDGEVFAFDLLDHPSAKVAYGWSDPVPGSDRRRFYAVLHAGPVASPEQAVRAAIVSVYRQARL